MGLLTTRGICAGALAVLLAGLLASGCAEKKPPPPKAQFVELVKVSGECSEDHTTQKGNYKGEFVHWYNPATGKHERFGSVTDKDSLSEERMKQLVEDQAKYQPPFIVVFKEVSAEDLAASTMTLHGVSEQADNSGGYHSTCQLTVIGRSDHLPPRTPSPADPVK